jgi:hypothetical protein
MRSARLLSAVVLVLCMGLSFVAATAAQDARPYLVKISRTDADVASLLREQNIPVNFKLADWYIAEAGESDLERLNAAGIESEILDREAWSQPYYLIHRPARMELGTVPDIGRIVFQDEMKAIVKAGSAQALELSRSGFQVTKIFQKALPLIDGREKEVSRLQVKQHTEDVIGAIVNQVSQETIRSYVQSLQDFQTRLWASDSIWAASQWLYDLFIEFGYTDVVFEEFIVSGEDYVWFQPGYDVSVRNVIATKPGVLYPDVVVVIGGHYDSIVIDGVTNPYILAPGSNDNASGTIGAVEAARILADIDLECTVKFACWTAEEIGLYGAEHYVEGAHSRGENIALYINYDMIANLDGSDPVRDINIGRNPGAETFGDLMVQMASQYTTLVPIPYTDMGGGSDHTPFIQYGYDILYASEGDFSPHWHQVTDIVENMDFPYFCEVVKMGLATLVAVAGPPESYPDPVIAFEEYEMDDDAQGGSTGNGNGYFDAGETVEISLRLHNYGGNPATDVFGQLITQDPYVTILDGMQSFGNIPGSGSALSEGPFRCALSEDIPNGHHIDFSLEVTGSGGAEWKTFFTVTVMQPNLVYTRLNFEETVGDGNSAFDPGETVRLSVNIENDGLRSASGISAVLETDDPDVTIIDNLAVFPDTDVDMAAVNDGDPFEVSLAEGADPRALLFTLRFTEGQGYYRTDLSFQILVGQGVVLLVADDGDMNNKDFYTEILNALGIPYDLEEEHDALAKSTLRSLSEYEEVIWFTGPADNNTLTPEDQTALAAYLENGGRLLLSGSLIGYDIGTTAFYRDYLQARFVSFVTLLHHLDGTSNPMTGGMSITLAAEGPNAQGFAGETDPVGTAFSLFNYDRGTEEGPGIIRSTGSGALAVQTSAYKLAYFSFGIEGIEPLEDRADVLSGVLAWFKTPGVDKGDVDGNGAINILDALITVNILLGIYEATEEEITRADMNSDGTINVLDVIGVVNALLSSGGGKRLSAAQPTNG